RIIANERNENMSPNDRFVIFGGADQRTTARCVLTKSQPRGTVTTVTLPPQGVRMSSATAATDGSAEAQAGAPRYGLGQLTAYAMRLGALGFGGPVALVGYMHRDLVERRQWITESEFKEGLTLAQLMPGPLAAQLAIYLGYVHHRVIGAT